MSTNQGSFPTQKAAVSGSANITGGQINNTLIGNVTPSTIVGTTIEATTAVISSEIGQDILSLLTVPAGPGTLATTANVAAPIIATDYCTIDLGGADDQYLVVYGVNAFNYLSDDPVNARRAPWPTGNENVGLIEVTPTVAVGADEDFKVEPWGCIYGYSGALSAASLSALDNVATARLTFNAGDVATKRFLGNFPAEIGAAAITHFVFRVSRLGSSTYAGQIRLDLHARP